MLGNSIFRGALKKNASNLHSEYSDALKKEKVKTYIDTECTKLINNISEMDYPQLISLVMGQTCCFI